MQVIFLSHKYLIDCLLCTSRLHKHSRPKTKETLVLFVHWVYILVGDIVSKLITPTWIKETGDAHFEWQNKRLKGMKPSEDLLDYSHHCINGSLTPRSLRKMFLSLFKVPLFLFCYINRDFIESTGMLRDKLRKMSGPKRAWAVRIRAQHTQGQSP